MEEPNFFYYDCFSERTYRYDKNMNVYSAYHAYCCCNQKSIEVIKKITKCKDIRTIGMACRRSYDGISMEDFKKLVSEMEKMRSKSKSEFEKFFTIKPVRFERETGNRKKDTFDFIRVDVGVPGYGMDKTEFIKGNINELNQKVLQKIKDNKRFQKFGVPINFLKLSNVVLRCDDLIEFTFELKDVEV